MASKRPSLATQTDLIELTQILQAVEPKTHRVFHPGGLRLKRFKDFASALFLSPSWVLPLLL